MIRRIFLSALLALAPLLALADLSTSQRNSLLTVVKADSTANGFRTAGDSSGLKGWLAQDSTFVVWKTSVTKEFVAQSDTFDWTRVDNLSVGKARIWDEMFDNPQRTINPSKTNVRTGIDSVWVGTQPDLNVRASVYASCQRFANRTEKTYTTGTGTSATPGFLVFEGAANDADVSWLIAQP